MLFQLASRDSILIRDPYGRFAELCEPKYSTRVWIQSEGRGMGDINIIPSGHVVECSHRNHAGGNVGYKVWKPSQLDILWLFACQAAGNTWPARAFSDRPNNAAPAFYAGTDHLHRHHHHPSNVSALSATITSLFHSPK